MAITFPDKSPIISYTHTLRSRYGETDKMGHVYHGRYLEYFEVARTEMIRSFGFSYRELEDQGVMLPVIHSELEFKVPVQYDEEMKIEVFVFDNPMVRLQTFYKVTTSGREQPHVIGEVTLCFMDAVTRKPCRAPKEFLDRIAMNSDN